MLMDLLSARLVPQPDAHCVGGLPCLSGTAVSVTTNRGSAYSFSNSQYTRWASTRNRCKSKSSPSSASTLSVVRLPSSNVSTTSRKRGE